MQKRKIIFGTYDTAVYGWTLTGWQLSPAEEKTDFVDIPGADGSADLSASLTGGIAKYYDRELVATFECSEGNRLSREPWTIQYADSEDKSRSNRTGDRIYDLQESTYWATAKDAELPHHLIINLGSKQQLTALQYLPRMEEGAPGSIKDYRIYVKDEPFTIVKE